MMLNVTRDVVNDLWPLRCSGEASADSQALIEAFLAEDTAFAGVLRESAARRQAVPPLRLSADAERLLFDEARRRTRNKLLLIGGGIGLAALLLLIALSAVLFLTFRAG
jgi:hypothetical protein